MRKTRLIEQNRCYHLISRLAHRAFFLDDEEKDRAVALMRRVEEFSGVVVLAYAFMSNHFHIFIYVPSAEEIGEEEILRRCSGPRGARPLPWICKNRKCAPNSGSAQLQPKFWYNYRVDKAWK